MWLAWHTQNTVGDTDSALPIGSKLLPRHYIHILIQIERRVMFPLLPIVLATTECMVLSDAMIMFR